MTTQMRISADNDYIAPDDPSEIFRLGDVVNVRPYSGRGPKELVYEFEHPNRPDEWFCCEARELDPLEPERDYEAEIEALTEKYDELLAVKNAALKIAAFTFEQYAEHHLAKGIPSSTLKALTNVGLQRMMEDAIEAD